MTPANFRIVDVTGKVHHTGLTSSQATALMSLMLADGKLPGLRSEPMDELRKSAPTDPTPAIVEAARNDAATAIAIRTIEPGSERDALRDAIEGHLDASARLDGANQAIERASAFVDARQTELDALQALHQDEIRSAGSSLAETLKAGGAAFEANRVIDRGAVLDAEVRRDTAKAALEQLTAEQTAADAAHTAAETAIRLAVMAVKRADVAAMVERLEAVKAEFTALATAIDAARFADVPMTIRAQDVTRLDVPDTGAISEIAARWHRYSVALRDDSQAAWEDQQ